MIESNQQRAVSPLIAVILLIGIVFAGATIVYMVGSTAIQEAETQTEVESAERTMTQVDSELSTLAVGGPQQRPVMIDSQIANDYQVVADERINITLRGGGCVDSRTRELGTILYEHDQGYLIGHQGGGIWRQSGGGSVMVSRPPIRYDTATTANGQPLRRPEIELVTLDGDVGWGENTARRSINKTEFDCDGPLVNTLEITVSTGDSSQLRFQDGWVQFFEAEFKTETTANDVETQNGDVVLTATIDSYGNPSQLINPQIYEGLQVTGGTTPGGITVTENGDTGQIVSNGDITVGASVNANLVSTGGIDGSAHVHGFALYNDTTTPSISTADGKEDSDALGTIANEDALDHNIDSEIDNITTAFDDPSSADPSAINDSGQYHTDTDLTIDSDIKTNDGNVDIAVDGDLNLDEIDIDGSGTTRIYVDGDITVDDSVTGHSSSQLQVYGTGDITVNDDFDGVLYAPDGGSVEFGGSPTVRGAVVGGDLSGTGAGSPTIDFDTSLQTDNGIVDK